MPPSERLKHADMPMYGCFTLSWEGPGGQGRLGEQDGLCVRLGGLRDQVHERLGWPGREFGVRACCRVDAASGQGPGQDVLKMRGRAQPPQGIGDVPIPSRREPLIRWPFRTPGLWFRCGVRRRCVAGGCGGSA